MNKAVYRLRAVSLLLLLAMLLAGVPLQPSAGSIDSQSVKTTAVAGGRGFDGRKKELITRFGSVKGVREASDEELLGVPGLTPQLVAAIREGLGG